MIRKLCCLILIIVNLPAAFAQDPHFSQYNNSRLNTNPAFTGTDSTMVVAANYRLQWPNISYPYQSFIFSIDKYIRKLRSGIGISLMHDSEMNGAYTKTRFEFNYAPHFELFHHTLVLQPALQAAYFQNMLDYSKLTFGDMIDARRGFVYSSNETHPGIVVRSNIDLSAGILIYNKHFWGGVAIHHLTQPDEGFFILSRLPMKITIHGGTNFSFKNDSAQKFVLSPTVLYQTQGDFHFILPGITAKYKFISLGFSCRSSDAFIVTLGFQNRFLRAGYSYDYTISKLANKNTRGAHELGLSWFINFKKKHCQINVLRLI